MDLPIAERKTTWFSLPGEIRNQVYRCLIQPAAPPPEIEWCELRDGHVVKKKNHDIIVSFIHEDQHNIGHKLLCTSKGVAQEFISLIASETLFRVESGKDMKLLGDRIFRSFQTPDVQTAPEAPPLRIVFNPPEFMVRDRPITFTYEEWHETNARARDLGWEPWQVASWHLLQDFDREAKQSRTRIGEVRLLVAASWRESSDISRELPWVRGNVDRFAIAVTTWPRFFAQIYNYREIDRFVSEALRG